MFAAAATAYALMLCQMPARLKEQAIITWGGGSFGQSEIIFILQRFTKIVCLSG
jgi:hypothetical protein